MKFVAIAVLYQMPNIGQPKSSRFEVLGDQQVH
jgi:hypothetical protein